MTHEQSDQERVESRAHLLPEEAAVGSDDPEAQADAILTESDIRGGPERRPGHGAGAPYLGSDRDPVEPPD